MVFVVLRLRARTDAYVGTICSYEFRGCFLISEVFIVV